MNEICRIKGRAGVGLLSALPVIDKRYGLPGLAEDVDSGRWIEADVKTPQGYTVTVVCVYVHAGNTDDPEKMKQKYRFLDTMLVRMGQLRDEAAHGGKQAVLCGDFNIAHTPLDIKNAKANEKHAGFLPEERAYVDKWLGELEFVDVMRSLCGDIQGPYTGGASGAAPSTTTSAGGSTTSSPHPNSPKRPADSSSTKLRPTTCDGRIMRR